MKLLKFRNLVTIFIGLIFCILLSANLHAPQEKWKEYYEKSIKAQNDENLILALDRMNKALAEIAETQNPNVIMLLHKKSELLFGLGEYWTANQILHETVQVFERSIYAHEKRDTHFRNALRYLQQELIMLVNSHIFLGNYNEARRMLDHYRDLGLKYSDRKTALLIPQYIEAEANLALALGNNKRAEYYFLNFNPSKFEYFLTSGRYFIEVGEYQEAIRVITKGLDLLRRELLFGNNMLTAALDLELKRAQILAKMHNVKIDLEAPVRIKLPQKEHIGEEHPLILKSQELNALEMLSNGNYEEAIDILKLLRASYLEKYRQQNPKVASIDNYIGIAEMGGGRLEEAEGRFRDAIAIFQERSEWHTIPERGRALLGLTEIELANKQFDVAEIFCEETWPFVRALGKSHPYVRKVLSISEKLKTHNKQPNLPALQEQEIDLREEKLVVTNLFGENDSALGLLRMKEGQFFIESDPARARRSFLQAIEVLGKDEEYKTSRELGLAYEGLATVFENDRDLAGAECRYSLAEKLYKANPLGKGKTDHSLQRVLRRLIEINLAQLRSPRCRDVFEE